MEINTLKKLVYIIPPTRCLYVPIAVKFRVTRPLLAGLLIAEKVIFFQQVLKILSYHYESLRCTAAIYTAKCNY